MTTPMTIENKTNEEVDSLSTFICMNPAIKLIRIKAIADLKNQSTLDLNFIKKGKLTLALKILNKSQITIGIKDVYPLVH